MIDERQAPRQKRSGSDEREVRLHIGGGTTILASARNVRRLHIGVDRVAADCFRHDPPTAAELESAITGIEDEIMRVAASERGRFTVTTRDHELHGLADLIGLPPANIRKIDRQAVENLYREVAACAERRLWPRTARLSSRRYAALVLILRELLHHLGFSAIHVLHPPNGTHSPET